MTDMTRPPGDQTPAAPDARGESALGTGRRTTAPDTGRHETARGAEQPPGSGSGLGTDRGTTPGPEAGRGVPHGTDADRAVAHGTDVPGTDRRADRPDADRYDTDPHDADLLGSGAPRGDHGTGSDKAGPAKNRAHLLAHEECDKLGSQLQHAVAGFVDGPRSAVEEADHVLEEIAARFTEAVTQRRRTLRHSWQSVEGGESRSVSSADTEQLRLALKDYRELAERLLHV
ncbi:hypothetical protein ABTX60_32810 [Streptomyces sp. NPDC126510]|uniref:hypothetical protein n=1 Tax=Streptomyces sp. NPDC126510 TaxID=3155317 RepID=UPI00333364A3